MARSIYSVQLGAATLITGGAISDTEDTILFVAPLTATTVVRDVVLTGPSQITRRFSGGLPSWNMADVYVKKGGINPISLLDTAGEPPADATTLQWTGRLVLAPLDQVHLRLQVEVGGVALPSTCRCIVSGYSLVP